MSVDIMKCVFCGQNASVKIIKFTSEIIKKCNTVLEYRRSKSTLRKLRTTYDNLVLPTETLLDEGYQKNK